VDEIARRQALADFLRTRRARLQPDEAFRLEFARQANEQLDREGWQPRS
jgi:hypothetical protein